MKLFFLILFSLCLSLVIGCIESHDLMEEDPVFTSFHNSVLQKYKNQEKIKTEETPEKKEIMGEPSSPVVPSALSTMSSGPLLDWLTAAKQNLGIGKKTVSQSLEDIYLRSMVYSNQIKVFSDLPLIRETGIEEARGRFDPKIYWEAHYNHTDEPVGSTLKTGGPSRFREDEGKWELGIRKKFITGTEVSLSQRLSLLDNNSQYTVPNPQNATQLSLTVTQPILREGWIHYNRSLITIAKIDNAIAQKEFLRQVETHLLEVTRAYWGLYLARLRLVREKQFLERLEKISAELKNRTQIDVLPSQISMAQAELAKRKASLIRISLAVKNGQSRLQALVNDPYLYENEIEIIPAEEILLASPSVGLDKALEMALNQRYEIDQAFLQVKAAEIREDIAKNELMPYLNLVFKIASNGLRENGDFTKSLYDQFSDGPSLGVGVIFEFPLGNREARARHLRRTLEKRQSLNQLETTMSTLLLEVKISHREVETAYQEILANQEAYKACVEELSALENRRVLEEQMSQEKRQYLSYFLELLINAQNRLLDSEARLLESAIGYNLALVNLRRATGTLLQYHGDRIPVRSVGEDGIPTIQLKPRKEVEKNK